MYSFAKRIVSLMMGVSLFSASLASAAGTASNLQIGLSDQEVKDFVLTESLPGALTDGGDLKLELPEGVYFSDLPRIEVIKGDLRVTNVRRVSNDRAVIIEIDGESTESSSLRVSGIKLKLDRMVPEGDVRLEIKGSAVDETSKVADWAGDDAVATFILGKVITPADKARLQTRFTIGMDKYALNGEDKSMDTAPYIKEGRTFLPVRFVANALGIPEDKVIWDPSLMTVTLVDETRVVQIQVGSEAFTVNGVGVPLELGAEITQGRVMLPLRGLAQAVGAEVTWDESLQTITITK